MNSDVERRHFPTLAIHILFIGIIFVLPEALLRFAIPSRTLEITWPMYAKSAITIGVFYLNFFLIIPKTLIAKKRNWSFIFLNILVILVGAFAIWFVYRCLYQGPHRNIASPLASMSYILRDSIMLLMAVSLAVAIRLSKRWIELESNNQKMMAARRQSEIESLRSQLNPHFLFNTLNSIYALISVSTEEAQKAVHELSMLLRYVVYENPRFVPLDREVEFVTNYVELMRLRMSDRKVELFVDRHDDGSLMIAPLLFVTLVENAFKHGNTSDTSLPIFISIKSRDNSLICATSNHIDRDVDTSADPLEKGVGLSNLRRRIELLYGSNASLIACPTGDDRFEAVLEITDCSVINSQNQ